LLGADVAFGGPGTISQFISCEFQLLESVWLLADITAVVIVGMQRLLTSVTDSYGQS